MSIVSQIKESEARRRREAVAQLCIILAEAAHGLGGQFILFGSAARGEIRYCSDVDLLLDFPDEQISKAYRVVEDACAQLDLEADIFPMRMVSERFLDRISGDMVYLS